MRSLSRLVALLLGAATLFAADQDGQTDYRGRLSDPKLRKVEARKWRAEFANLDKRIPTLSPAEELWLRTEIEGSIRDAGGAYTKRAMDAESSREYAVRITKPHLHHIIEVLDRIIAYNIPGQKGETRQWAELASAFMELKFWQEINKLVRLQIVGNVVDGFDSFYFENHVLRAQEILLFVVIPSI